MPIFDKPSPSSKSVGLLRGMSGLFEKCPTMSGTLEKDCESLSAVGGVKEEIYHCRRTEISRLFNILYFFWKFFFPFSF